MQPSQSVHSLKSRTGRRTMLPFPPFPHSHATPHLLPRLSMVNRAGVKPLKFYIPYDNHCTFNVQISLPGCHPDDQEMKNGEMQRGKEG
jgi:hypothetical protein